jgi:hypothetical protein
MHRLGQFATVPEFLIKLISGGQSIVVATNQVTTYSDSSWILMAELCSLSSRHNAAASLTTANSRKSLTDPLARLSLCL